MVFCTKNRNTALGVCGLYRSDRLTVDLCLKGFGKHDDSNTLFHYIYAHKHDTGYIFEKVDRQVIPIKDSLNVKKKKKTRKNH